MSRASQSRERREKTPEKDRSFIARATSPAFGSAKLAEQDERGTSPYHRRVSAGSRGRTKLFTFARDLDVAIGPVAACTGCSSSPAPNIACDFVG